MPRRTLVLALVLALLSGCSSSGAGEETVEPGPGAESAGAAVEQLFERLSNGDFGAAASLALPEQAALASLSEGASFEEVAAALRDGDVVVAANFWSGFAQSVDSLLRDGVEVVGTETETTQGAEFSTVEIATANGDLRHITARDSDGYRIDIFATFGPSLASRLYPQVELLFTEQTEDSSLILGRLREQVPSLFKASQTPELAPNVVQDILQLIELITRID